MTQYQSDMSSNSILPPPNGDPDLAKQEPNY
eukprot:CAMPEP_0196245396 /NCGR_PEP_ID=MMETSP0913-20130531/33083_1 /TAXON_ID=49265 /ORGANISM="Thalassiosira rotula, Strain GSO102" /LENGTH=30 /DNA_ID= /DNA_START= /DNA_END= /DNA_ORIENTATION=